MVYFSCRHADWREDVIANLEASFYDSTRDLDRIPSSDEKVHDRRNWLGVVVRYLVTRKEKLEIKMTG
jgi:hypothetical protein